MKISCPLCEKQAEVPDGFRHRPFCSRRCQMADLGNWFNEAYRFSRPVRPDDLEDDEMLL